jgi:hypothetical protein
MFPDDDETTEEGQEELRRREPEEPTEEREEREDAPEDNEPEVRIREENGRTSVEMQPSRKDKRARQRREEAEAHFKEFSRPLNDKLEQMVSTIGQLAASMRQGGQSQAQERRQGGDEQDDFDRIMKEQEIILRQVRTPGLSEEQVKELTDRYKKLNRELLEGTADRRVKAALKEFKPAQGPDTHEAMLRAKYADVFGNDNARDYAWALFLQMRAKAAGKPFDVAEAHEKALSDAAYEFGLRRRQAPAPSKAQQARFGGTRADATERSAGKPRHDLTREERTMAREMFSRQKDWSDEKKFSEWAKRMEKTGYWEGKDE